MLSNVDPSSTLANKEVFGPVCYLQVADSFEDACHRANASRYGLQVGVFTDSQKHMWYAYDNLDVVCFVNINL